MSSGWSLLCWGHQCEEIVEFLEYAPNLEASVAIRSKIFLINEFRMVIALLDEEMVEYAHNLEASVAIRSKISLMNEFRMVVALLEIPA